MIKRNLVDTEELILLRIKFIKMCIEFTEKKTIYFCNYLNTYSFEYLYTALIIKQLIKHKARFSRKVFTDKKFLQMDFQNFHVSWKAIKSISWTVCGSLQNEVNVKEVFHEMIWKKNFTVCPCLHSNFEKLSGKHSCCSPILIKVLSEILQLY